MQTLAKLAEWRESFGHFDHRHGDNALWLLVRGLVWFVFVMPLGIAMFVFLLGGWASVALIYHDNLWLQIAGWIGSVIWWGGFLIMVGSEFRE